MEDLICSAKKKSRDLSIDQLKIAGKEPVRDIIIITPKDVKKNQKGQYEVVMSYRLKNEGYLSSKDFENLVYFNDKIVSRQQGLSMGPNETKIFTDKNVAVDIKDGIFMVRTDAFSKVTEDDETNNDISSKLVFRGFASNTPKTPQLHIEMLRIANRPPVRQQLKLSKHDAIAQKQGRYSFQVEYVIRNYGIADAVDFDNVFYLDGKGFFRQPHLTLKAGESRLMSIPVFFPIRSGKITLRADATMKYPKGTACMNTIEFNVHFQGFSNTTV